MDQTEATQEPPPGPGPASPMPAAFYWALWIPAFAAIVWGMSTIFRSRTLGPRAGREDDDETG